MEKSKEEMIRELKNHGCREDMECWTYMQILNMYIRITRYQLDKDGKILFLIKNMMSVKLIRCKFYKYIR